jgi:hypothetical protein
MRKDGAFCIFKAQPRALAGLWYELAAVDWKAQREAEPAQGGPGAEGPGGLGRGGLGRPRRSAVQPQRTPAATTTCEKLLAAVETELQKKTARLEGLEQTVGVVTDQLAAFAEAAGEREHRLEQQKGKLEEAVEVQEQKHGRERARVEQQREKERAAFGKELGIGELPPPLCVCTYNATH